MSGTPEQLARETMDAQLAAAGWVVQGIRDLNLAAGKGVAQRFLTDSWFRMNFELQKILESKVAHRQKLADLRIGEKLRLLDAMRERAIAMGNASPSSNSSLLREDPAPYRAK